MNPAVGKYIVLVGLALMLIGGIIYCFGDKLGWLGRLPGDIRVENKDGVGFTFPS